MKTNSEDSSSDNHFYKLCSKDEKEVWNSLKNSRLFSFFPEALLRQLVPLSELADYSVGSVILEEGVLNTKIFFLVSGTVGVYANNEPILTLHRRGDIFGEMSVISNKRSSAAVVAETPVRLFSILAKDVGSYTDINTDVLHHVLYRIFSMMLTEKLFITTKKAQHYEQTSRDLERTQEELKHKISEYEQAKNEVERAQEELIASYERFSGILEIAEDAIISVDENYRIVLFNRGAEKIFGYGVHEILGQPLTVLIPDRFKKAHQKNVKKFGRSNEKSRSMGGISEIKGLRSDGCEFFAEASISQLEVRKEKLFTVILRDITERKLAEDRIRMAQQNAEQANQAKSIFLTNISHEIRTPMNAILGFAEILERQITDKQHQQFLATIRSSGKTLLGLINNILDLSKIESGKFDLEYTVVNPQLIFKEMKQLFEGQIHEKGLAFIMEIDPGLPKYLILDGIRLREILLNLLGNAVKFTASGRIKLAIVCQYPKRKSFSRPNLSLVISVEDTGIGIPKEQHKLIFEAFEQQKGQSHNQYKGTGLGLAITKRLVQMMDGRIEVKSDQGKGATFRVTLKNIEIAAISSELEQELPLAFKSIMFKNKSILIVEDIEVNRNVIKGFLEGHGVQLWEADNGKVGLELAQKIRPDLILMDMRMPVMDGYEATTILKQDKDLKQIPVIALTASAIREEEKKIRNLCNAFLSKPVSKSELMEMLMQFLDHSIEIAPSPSLPAPTSQMISPEVRAQLPELKQHLEDHLQGWKKMSTQLISNEIEAFAQKMLNWGSAYHYEPLSHWAKQLESEILIFDLEAFQQTLKSFPEIIKTLEADLNSELAS
ncbi:ATP-binding protein [Deltaproteobacteria bacterium TL4]